MMEMSFELDPCIIDFDGSVTEFELEKMREYLPTSIQEHVEVGAGGLGNSISSGRDILLLHHNHLAGISSSSNWPVQNEIAKMLRLPNSCLACAICPRGDETIAGIIY